MKSPTDNILSCFKNSKFNIFFYLGFQFSNKGMPNALGELGELELRSA